MDNFSEERLKEKRLPQNLPEDSLASLDAWGDRIFIYPAKVKGLWSQRRKILHFILMIVFLSLPWIKIGGHQSILLNIPDRQFALFGLTFFAHDGPLTFFILGILTIGLAAITAVWGRVWCGWACPQTVFIDVVFRKIEEWVEGNHITRRKLNESEFSLEKLTKKIIKWALYTAASLIITHSLLAYFVGAERLMAMVQSSPKENWVPFVIILFTTAIVLFDFGWFREQFCIIMCPYGRFQSVLMDENSLAVAYDVKRGEPRRGVAKDKSSQGDCIDCLKCVAVCPTGIDIRNGLQMECIACTACIDACDQVMTKTKKPTGLIRYSTEKQMNLSAGKTTDETGLQIFRPRFLVYCSLILGLIAGLSIAVSKRQEIHLSVVRAIKSPYTITAFSDGKPAITNQFNVSMKNQTFKPVKLQLELPENYKASHELNLVMPQNPVIIPPGETVRFPMFLQFPKDLTGTSGAGVIPLIMKNLSHPTSSPQVKDLSLAGPRQ